MMRPSSTCAPRRTTRSASTASTRSTRGSASRGPPTSSRCCPRRMQRHRASVTRRSPACCRRTPTARHCMASEPTRDTARRGRIATLRSALPSGTATVGIGLIVLGVSSYLFLAIAARELSTEAFSTLSVLWVAVYTVGPGLFFPLEQEVARAIADRLTKGEGGAPVFLRAAALGLGLVGLLLVLCAIATPTLLSNLFDGSTGVLAALLLSLIALWAAHLCRGALAGGAQFRSYGAMLATEGIGRSVGCIALAVAAVHWLPAYGLLLPSALLLSVIVVLPPTRRVVRPGPSASWNEVSGALGWLLFGALFSQLLVNVGPLAVKLLASTSEHNQAGRFLAGSVLVRVPLFLFSAVQAALLPGLANLAGRGQYDEFKLRLGRLLLLVAGVGAVATIGSAVVGPELLRLLFGAKFRLSEQLLVELAIANSVYMLGVVLSQALVALRQYRTVAMGWASGVVAFVLVTAGPGSILHRATNGFVVGAVVSFAIFGLSVLRAVAQRQEIAPEPINLSAYPLFEE